MEKDLKLDVSGGNVANSTDQKTTRSRKLLLCTGGAIVFVVIALGLGLGLGLDLSKKKTLGSSNTSSGSSTQSSSHNSLSVVESWRRSTLDYNLDADWNFNASPTDRVYNWNLTEIQIAPDGVERTVLAINGQFPGPLIRVNRGDRVLVNVTNSMSNATSIHWHGLFQNGTNWMDGTTGVTQCAIQPGNTFLYNFTVENQYGTHWYHSHYSSQYTDGLVGPFIIHAPDEDPVRKTYDYDQVILVSDWYHDLSSALMPSYLASGSENTEPTPDNGLIQGTNFFDCSLYGSDSGYTCNGNSTRAAFAVSQNKRYRWRIINTSAFTEFIFSVDNHTLSVIEADSTLVQPVGVHRVPINVAERYSVILETNQTAGNYWVRAQMNSFCFSQTNPVLDPGTQALLTYTNSTTDPTTRDWTETLQVICEDLNTAKLVPYFNMTAPAATVKYTVDASFQIGGYALDRGYFNSTTWVASTPASLNLAVAGLNAGNTTFSDVGLSTGYNANQFVINVGDYQVVDLLINSLDEGAHPFHLHGYEFWIMATGSQSAFNWNDYGSLNTTNPMRRDTIMIGPYGWALIRFKADNPGLWALHCHISWHIASGLLMQFQTRSDIMKDWTLPSDVQGLCNT